MVCITTYSSAVQKGNVSYSDKWAGELGGIGAGCLSLTESMHLLLPLAYW